MGLDFGLLHNSSKGQSYYQNFHMVLVVVGWKGGGLGCHQDYSLQILIYDLKVLLHIVSHFSDMNLVRKDGMSHDDIHLEQHSFQA